MYYAQNARDDLKKKYPNEGITDIAKRIGAAWNKLDDSEKKKFVTKSEKDKERYQHEMKNYKKED